MKTGQLIREQRLTKGMTQEDLAAKTNTSARTIQRIENGEVTARAYNLQNIAAALNIEFAMLNQEHPGVFAEDRDTSPVWLPLLHISGLFNLLLPPLIIWLMKREKVKNMTQHGIAVLNFQLSMLLYEAICGLLYRPFIPLLFLLVILALFSLMMVLVNTLKVINGQPFKYPLSINILKQSKE